MWTPMRLAVAAAILGCLAPAGAAALEEETGSYWYAVDHITRVDEDGRIVLWTVLPPDRPEQKVEITDIQPEPVAILEDRHNGNRIVEWSVIPETGFEPGIELFHVDFVFEEIPVAFEFGPGEVRPYDETAAAYSEYTGSEIWIQTDGAILDEARRIIGDERNPWRRALAIYDWVVAELEFVPGAGGQRDAKSTLIARKGDFGQISALYCALCRSVGIPARTVTSVWTRGGSHVAAEIFLQGIGWVPMDPALGQSLRPGASGMTDQELARYTAAKGVPLGDARWPAGRLGSHRLTTSVGNNIRFESPTLGRTVEFRQMNPGGSAAHPPAVLLEGLNRDVIHGGFHVFGRRLRDEQEAHELTHQRLASLFFTEGLHRIVENSRHGLPLEYAGEVQSWINEGKILMHKGEYYAAEAAFKRAMRGAAADREEKLESIIWTHNYLGNCYDMLGYREMAKKEYQEVIDLGNDYRGAVEYARKYLRKPFTKKVIDER